jgi:hypothetical protein
MIPMKIGCGLVRTLRQKPDNPAESIVAHFVSGEQSPFVHFDAGIANDTLAAGFLQLR